jgi:sugar O-acyltransferase, sialic acid O-acetyltransferase neuD family
MKKIVIVGAGGMGRETAWLIEQINDVRNEWEILGFIVDDIELKGKVVNGYSILGDSNYLKTLSEDIFVIVAIGNGKIRENIIKRIGKKKFATLIHPNVNIAKSSKVEEGCIICSGAVISIDTKISKHCIINFNSIIAHDVILEDFVTIHVNVNISGNVKIGRYSIIGSGTSIHQKKVIGENCIIGIGSSVIKNIKDNKTALGVPAEIF